MIWLLVFLSLLIVILVYLLLAPFHLELDSTIGLCRFRFHRIASLRFYIAGDSLVIDLRILWWVKTINLFDPKKRKEKQIVKKKKKKKVIPFRKIWAVIKSFKVNKCMINIDTGDLPLNGILYPAFLWISIQTKKKNRNKFSG